MYNAGLEQALGSHLVFDADYFWKYTRNAFDLDNLFTTAIFFPIEWDHSKMDGFSSRLSLRQYKGLSAYTTLGHTRARVFGPENGGLIFGSPVDRTVVRIDHDQALQSTTHVQYQLAKNGPWVAFTWRYDSGIVSGAVPDLASVLGLTADQQAQIEFYCGNQVATPWSPITTCNSSNWGTKLVRIPAPGTENDDTNPPRVRPRHLFNIGVGTRQPLPHRPRALDIAPGGSEHHEQSGAVQFPVHLLRDALRCAADIPGGVGYRFLAHGEERTRNPWSFFLQGP